MNGEWGGLAALLFAAAVPILGGQRGSGSEQWLGVFRSLPGAVPVCSGHVLGSSEGQRVEISFSLYGSTRDPADVARFYADAHRLPWKSGQDHVDVRAADGRRLLSVQPASAPHPTCGVEPKPDTRTIIVVSAMTR